MRRRLVGDGRMAAYGGMYDRCREEPEGTWQRSAVKEVMEHDKFVQVDKGTGLWSVSYRSSN